MEAGGGRAINHFFGTHLQRSDFDTIVVPRSWRLMADHLPTPSTLIKMALLMRYTPGQRRVQVLFGVYNETDYGRRGIQYVHYPTYWGHAAGRRSALVSPAAIRIEPVLRARRSHRRLLIDRLKANLTLVNSDWTGEHVGKFLGIQTRTLYPPVVDLALALPWGERNAFLAVGRISPEKNTTRDEDPRASANPRPTSLTIVGTRDRHAHRF
jgi:hypothetical protein